MTRLAKVYQNGRSQAVRIPKEFRVDTTEVYMEKVGETLVIRPKPQNRWDIFFRMLDETDTSGFFTDRIQPPLDDKELF